MNFNPKMSADALLEDALRAVDGTSADRSDELPMPKSSGAPGAGLPSPKINGAASLPSPKINGAAGLPSPKINGAAGLPSPKINGAAGLPSPKINGAAGLPSPKGSVDAFPSPKPAAVDDFPSLRAPGGDASLNALEHAVSQRVGRRGTMALGSFSLDDALEDDLPSARPGRGGQHGLDRPDLDVPKVRLGKEPPSVHSGHVMADGHEPVHDFDNDSGLPLNDDPLGLGAGRAQPQSGFDDILGLLGNEGSPAPAEPGVPLARTVPLAPTAAAPKAPVAAAAPKTPVAAAAPKAPARAVPDAAAGGGIVEAPASEEEAEGELFELDTIRKDGQGLARPMTEADPAQVAKNESMKRQKKIMVVAGICVLAIGVLLFIGYMVLGILDKRAEEAMNAAPVVQQDKVVVNWDIVNQDRLFFYQTFNKRARERLAQADVGGDERAELQGKLLLNGALALVRNGEVFKMLVQTLDTEAEKLQASGNEWEILGAWAWGKMRGNEALFSKLAEKLPSGEAFDDYKATIEFAAEFSAWELDGQTFAQRMDTGKRLLKAYGDSASELPLHVWMHAETLNRLGRYEDALAVLEKVKVEEEGEMFPSGVLYLLAETYLKMDDIGRASAVADRLLKTSEPGEKARYEKLRMLCDVSQKPWSEMSDKVRQYIDAHKAESEELMFASYLCRRVNRSMACRAFFANALDGDSRNLGLRKAYLGTYLASLGYHALIRPDGGLIRPQLESLLRIVEEGIVQSPEDIDLWKTKALVTYAQKDYEASIRAVDEVERGKDMLWFGRFLRELMTFESSENVQKGTTGHKLKQFANDVLEPDESIPLAQALAFVGELSASHQILERAMLIYPEETLILDDYYDCALALKDIQLSANILERMRKRGALLGYHEYEYARLIEQLGDIDTALEKMVYLVDQTKDEPNYEFMAYVGELFLKQGKCDNALPYFSKALAVNPNDPRTRYNKGQCLYKNKKYDEALIEFNEAATQDDTNHMYDLWIGQALAGLQQMSEAHRAFTAVIDSYVGIPVEKLSEQDVFILSEAHYFRAEIRKLQSRRSEARDDYLEALKLRSNERRYLTGYGIYLYENGNTKECIDTVTKIESLQAESMDSVLYFVRGLSKLKLNKPQEAVIDLEKARRAGYAELEESGVVGVREPAELYERLGYLYRDLGRKEEARQTLRLFLEKTTALSPSARREVQGELDKI
ncbi:MAG: tetratricopeptide repeat protein [Proteobacteria bacterium]|nr:tetratricopeptide repeat protein [Pseudomonadota bacterium]